MPLSVRDYFERAMRRGRSPQPSPAPIRDDDGNAAAFSLSFDGGFIRNAEYRCTTCVTLVGLCEHLSEMLAGMPAEAALRLTPDQLLALHPEVPPSRRDRAVLSLRALHHAIQL